MASGTTADLVHLLSEQVVFGALLIERPISQMRDPRFIATSILRRDEPKRSKVHFKMMLHFS